MSNTYFKIEKSVEYGKHGNNPYTNNYEMDLTAFIGGEDCVQLTVSTSSTVESQCGCGCITLSYKDIDNLIAGLLERKLNKISVTGDEQSSYCPAEQEASDE